MLQKGERTVKESKCYVRTCESAARCEEPTETSRGVACAPDAQAAQEGRHHTKGENVRVHVVEKCEVGRQGRANGVSEDLHLEDEQARKEEDQGKAEDTRQTVIGVLHEGPAFNMRQELRLRG